MIRETFGAIVVLVAMLLADAAFAQTVKCELRYDLEGWSVFYRFGEGTGHISCSNGESATVSVRAHAGGISFGTEQVIGGTGSFSAVSAMNEIYGTYFDMGAHAGAGRSADARFMMKGSGNLALAGNGQGINLGFAFGSFSIQPQ